MNKKVLVPLADGFEEIEAVTIIDVLRRAEVDVVTAGLRPGPAHGAHGIDVTPDADIASVDADAFDMIVLPGGMPGAVNLRKSAPVQRILESMKARGCWTAAICAAPMALGPSGITASRTVTSYPGFGDEFEHAAYVEDRVVVDGPVVTSRGPGTALEFALTLVNKLVGEAKANELAQAMLISTPVTALEI